MSIQEITKDQLRRMGDQEGLILQGCGGDLQDWVDGINVMLTEDGVFKKGAGFQEAYSFKHDGLTCLLLPFKEGLEMDVGRLALWKLQTHTIFGGTWLSDYVPNRLGGFVQEQERESVKPDCPLIGQNGNIMNLIGIAGRTLREHGMEKQATEMFNRITQCQSYDSALSIIGDYVNITSVEQTENMDMDMDYDREDSFFYLDPPYFKSEYVYEAEFGWEQHVLLRDTLANCKEDLLYMALKVQIDREYYCQKGDLRFLEDVNLKRPKSMSEFKTLWYNGSSRRGVHYDSTRYHALNLHSVFSKGTIEFRMFNSTLHAGEVKSYIQLCLAISHQALIQQRAMRTRTQSENEKYTFRTWLLRLGLIGDEFKTARQHLLKNLDGNIAWKDPAQAIRQRERQIQQRLEQSRGQPSISAAPPDTVQEVHQQQEEAPALSMEEQC